MMKSPEYSEYCKICNLYNSCTESKKFACENFITNVKITNKHK